MRHYKFYFTNILLFTLVLSSLSSCSYLQKMKNSFKGNPIPEIEGAEDLSTPSDIDYLNLGSDSGNIQGLSSVYFDLDSSGLSENVKESLQANKAWLDSNPKVESVILEGHCDPLGSEAYNIGLGDRRAQRVYNYLVSIGLSADKLKILSYGEEKIFSQTDNSLNRRVNFVPQY